MFRKYASLVLATVMIVSACASTPSDGPRRQFDLITTEEIEATNVSNLHQLVERLRPRWLDVRGQQSFSTPTAIVVFHGQSYLGGVEMLRQMGKGEARVMRYLDGPTASATLPGLSGRQVEAAIVINPRD